MVEENSEIFSDDGECPVSDSDTSDNISKRDNSGFQGSGYCTLYYRNPKGWK